MEISKGLPDTLKKSKWYVEARGDSDGSSYVELDLVKVKDSGNYGALALARVERAEFEFLSGGGVATVKAYDPAGARDCDHWTARVFDAEIEDLKFSHIAYNRIEFYGYLKELYTYPEGEGPDADAPEKCYCGKSHGFVDSFLPPKIFGDKGGTSKRLLVRGTVYPSKAYSLKA